MKNLFTQTSSEDNFMSRSLWIRYEPKLPLENTHIAYRPSSKVFIKLTKLKTFVVCSHIERGVPRSFGKVPIIFSIRCRLPVFQ